MYRTMTMTQRLATREGRLGARPHQSAVGLGLAGLVVSCWMSVHIAAVFVIDWRATPLALAAVLVVLQTWLSVGLFIVAHDAMHGSLAPRRLRINRWVGRVCLFLYAGFVYDWMIRAHFAHHRRPGTADDPDFHPDAPDRFLPWLLRFMHHYFDLRQSLVTGAAAILYAVTFSIPPWRLAAFWALPSLLAALQLFTFGTFLPHRAASEPFADGHNARSNDYGTLVSLLTCFHFGYHHEHHLSPGTPWWRLPALRAERRTQENTP